MSAHWLGELLFRVVFGKSTADYLDEEDSKYFSLEHCNENLGSAICRRPKLHKGSHCGARRCDYEEHQDICRCLKYRPSPEGRCMCGGFPIEWYSVEKTIDA